MLVPLAAIILASVLAVVPVSTSGVPVLSSLEAQPADAHDPLMTIPIPRTVCRDVYKKVIVGSYHPLGPSRPAQYIYGYRWVEECGTEHFYITIVHPHSHGFREECTWMTVAANVATLGLIVRMLGNSALVWVCQNVPDVQYEIIEPWRY